MKKKEKSKENQIEKNHFVSAIKCILEEELERTRRCIEANQEFVNKYPGRLYIKKRKDREYLYLQCTINKKPYCGYLGPANKESAKELIKKYKEKKRCLETIRLMKIEEKQTIAAIKCYKPEVIK